MKTKQKIAHVNVKNKSSMLIKYQNPDKEGWGISSWPTMQLCNHNLDFKWNMLLVFKVKFHIPNSLLPFACIIMVLQHDIIFSKSIRIKDLIKNITEQEYYTCMQTVYCIHVLLVNMQREWAWLPHKQKDTYDQTHYVLRINIVFAF